MYQDVESLVLVKGCTLELYTHYDCLINYELGHYKEKIQGYFHDNLIVEDMGNQGNLRPYSKSDLALST